MDGSVDFANFFLNAIAFLQQGNGAAIFFFANLEQCLLAEGFALGAKLRDFGGRQGVGSLAR